MVPATTPLVASARPRSPAPEPPLGFAPPGTAVGTGAGVSDGFSDGVSDGVFDGVSDGFSDGVSDGFSDGVSDGFSDGVDVGVDVGVGVGVDVLHGPWLKLNWPVQAESITAVADTTVLSRFSYQ